MESLQALAGLAFIIALFAAYTRERRNRRKAAEPTPLVAPQVAAGPSPEPDANATAEVRSYGSPNWGAPIVFTGLLIGAATHRGSFWGYLWQTLYFAVLAVAAYSTFSSKELADEQKRRPGTTRRDVYLRMGIPYLLIPFVAWVLTIPLGLGAAAFLPALPWLFLAGLGVVLSLRAKSG